jgi:crotonobetainyl-CoA:carnitine CoA-transferase CaiB-like acyl-CoA transferase
VTLRADDAAVRAALDDLRSAVLPAPRSPFTLENPLPHQLGSRWPVTTAAVASVVAAATAASSFQAACCGTAPRTSAIDVAHVMALFASERVLRVNGAPLAAWDPLTGDYRARDGRWVRIHANFPHHRAAALTALGALGSAERAQLAAAVGTVDASDVEERVIAAGGCAAELRHESEWGNHPQGRAVSGLPLVIADDNATPSSTRVPMRDAGWPPLASVRVLDLSRVIAGPVAARALANFGANTLRVGAPDLAQVPQLWVDTGFGKGTVRADLTEPAGARRVRELAVSADVIIQAYRPGCLSRYGLDAQEVVEANPGVVYVNLSAWGAKGPWSSRRGFDSLVQMATGLAYPSGPAAGDGGRPEPLPLQALDHATGWLAAYAACAGLEHRVRYGRGTVVQVSLAQTARWLMRLPTSMSVGAVPPRIETYLDHSSSTFGQLLHVRPLQPWRGLALRMTPPTGLDDPVREWPRSGT